MSVKGIGSNTTVQQVEPRIEIKDVATPPPPQAPVADSFTRAGDNEFAGAVKKEAINRAFDDTGIQAPAAPPKPPIDYFEVDKQADELIQKNTDEHWYGDNLKTKELGQELAEIAKADPEKAAALTDNILDKIGSGDKDDLAQSIAGSMSPEELRKFAGSEKGAETLEKLRGHLDAGWTTGNEDQAIAKINIAIKSAELEKSPGFKKLDAAVQKEIFTRLQNNATNEKAVDNLINLAKDKSFQDLPPAAQKSMLSAYDNHKEDTVFIDGLKTLASKVDFKALSETQRNQVISDLDKFANSESYQGTKGIFGHGVSDNDKRYLLDKIGNTATLSANDPTNAAARNTLNKIINNDVRIETYSEPAKKGRITFGTNNGNGVLRINTHPDANNYANGANKFTDTVVHELNHQLNQGAKHGTPEQFLNEYRAAYVGFTASGTTVDAPVQENIINNSITNYNEIKGLYESDSENGKKFKEFIDNAKAGLNKTPPELLDPEKMRQQLDVIFDNDYLNHPGNVDNH